MKRSVFESHVHKAYESIPEKFRLRLTNVAICIDDVCVEDPDWLGLYEGVPLVERDLEVSGMVPDSITLFQRAIEEEAEGDDDVYRVVRETLIHEIAHYFGFDEDEVEAKFEAKFGK